MSAVDLLSSSVRVNSVCPSWVGTPTMQASLEHVPQLGVVIKAAISLKRAEVPEVVDYFMFLCAPVGTYINGTRLIADAGLTLTMHT